MWKKPATGSALARFWDVLGDRIAPPSALAGGAAPTPLPRLFARFPVGWETSQPNSSVPIVSSPPRRADALPFDWARATARHVGTVAHRLLAQIGREGAPAWSASRVAALTLRIRAELAGEGVDDAEIAAAVTGVATAISRLLADERGRWLLDPAHAEANSEWALASVEGNAIAHVALDRTFVADGVRWIVDFKTGAHEGADVEAFLDREQERYRGQLERYARVVRALDARPIRLGIYHPMLRGWREWPFAG